MFRSLLSNLRGVSSQSLSATKLKALIRDFVFLVFECDCVVPRVQPSYGGAIGSIDMRWLPCRAGASLLDYVAVDRLAVVAVATAR